MGLYKAYFVEPQKNIVGTTNYLFALLVVVRFLAEGTITCRITYKSKMHVFQEKILVIQLTFSTITCHVQGKGVGVIRSLNSLVLMFTSKIFCPVSEAAFKISS